MSKEQRSPPIILVAERFGHSGGGEAVKAQQYADFLLAQNRDFVVITHERSVRSLGAALPGDRLMAMPDTRLQRWLWRIKPLRSQLSTYFHVRSRGLIAAARRRLGPTAILHYISPVSPALLRFPPKGLPVVLGPLTGNIYYPPAFAARTPRSYRIRERFHHLFQISIGRLSGEKRRAKAILVSGYERTRQSLEWAGAFEDSLIDVMDSGVSELALGEPRTVHAGANYRFVCSGRLVDYKGIDLAIRAVAYANPAVILDIFGDGVVRPTLEQLVASLGLGERVVFRGWLKNQDLLRSLRQYRGYLFPSLAEANGIAMQEAMAIGLPVVTLRWGGPAMLADDDAAIYVDPNGEEQVVNDIAAAMNRLAENGDYADAISAKARAIAEQRFAWDVVARSWQAAYEKCGR